MFSLLMCINHSTSLSIPESRRDESTIQEEDADNRETMNVPILQELGMEKPHLLIANPQDLMIKEEDAETQESPRRKCEIKVPIPMQVEGCKQETAETTTTNTTTNKEANAPKRNRPKISDLINKVIEKLESEQIVREDATAPDGGDNNIKLESGKVSIESSSQPQDGGQDGLHRVDNIIKKDKNEDEKKTLTEETDYSSGIKLLDEKESEVTSRNETERVWSHTIEARSGSNPKVSKDYLRKGSHESMSSMKRVLGNQLKKEEPNKRVVSTKKTAFNGSTTILTSSRNSLNASFTEPQTTRRSLSNKRIGITPRAGLGRDISNIESRLSRPTTARAKYTPTVFTSTSQNGSRPNSSGKVRMNKSLFLQGENETSFDKLNNANGSKSNKKYAATANNLSSPSSAKILQTRLSTPNLSQRKSSMGKITTQPKGEKETKPATISKSTPYRNQKNTPSHIATSHQVNEKEKKLFAIAETDNFQESEQALNKANTTNNKTKQTENPLMKKPLKPNKTGILRPMTSNTKAAPIKKDQPSQQRRNLHPTTPSPQVSIQKQKTTTHHTSAKDLKSHLPSQRTNPPQTTRPKNTPSRNQSSTNSALASPRTLDHHVESVKVLSEYSKAQRQMIPDPIIETHSAKETNSTDISPQKVVEPVSKSSNINNKKRIFEIMSQACE